MKDIYSIIVKPLITEKSSDIQGEKNKYTFKTHLNATKRNIKAAVEELFKVKVNKVRTCVYHGKKVRVGRQHGYKSKWKKAMVTLQEGEHIEFFEGV